MRKVVGVSFAAALVQSVGVATSDAGITGIGNGTCGKVSGKAAFAPPLPICGSKTKVKTKLTATETQTGCKGGGVTSAKVTLSAIPESLVGAAPLNCTYLFTSTMTVMGGTETITWNNRKTSTVSIGIQGRRGKDLSVTLTFGGNITAGLFNGDRMTEIVNITSIPPGTCTKHPMGQTTLNSSKSNSY